MVGLGLRVQVAVANAIAKLYQSSPSKPGIYAMNTLSRYTPQIILPPRRRTDLLLEERVPQSFRWRDTLVRVDGQASVQ